MKTYVCFMINGLFKIGKSNDPFFRINSFKTSNPMISETSIVINEDCEEFLHSCFNDCRVEREWFYIGYTNETSLTEHAEFIKKLCVIAIGMKLNNEDAVGNIKKLISNMTYEKTNH